MSMKKDEAIKSLKTAIKSLEKLSDEADVICVIMQYQTKEGKYIVNHHINNI